MSAEIVALLVLAGGAVAAVVFTLVIVVVVVDPSDANPRADNEGEKDEKQQSEKS